MEIRPHRASIDAAGRAQNVMMIVPINAYEDEAHDIRRERRQNLTERCKIGAMRWMQFSYHDRDDHRDRTIAKGFEPRGFSGERRLHVDPLKAGVAFMSLGTQRSEREYLPRRKRAMGCRTAFACRYSWSHRTRDRATFRT